MTSAEPRIASLGQHVASPGPHVASSGPRIASSGPRIASSDPRVASSGPRVASSGPRVASSGPRVASLGPQNDSAAGETRSELFQPVLQNQPVAAGAFVEISQAVAACVAGHETALALVACTVAAACQGLPQKIAQRLR